jgi:acetyl-CoA synthetase
VHVHEAAVAHNVTGKLALDLHTEDIFWCTTNPGWVTGTSYGIISPLTNGVTMIVDQAEFDAERWYRILQDHKVTVWYTAPTAIRMLMKAGADFAKRFDLTQLRLMASVGGPLNPEAVLWGLQAFGRPFHDNWWQTETGGIMITNFLSMDVKPGSMGRPLPGIEAGIVERLEGGGLREITRSMAMGELALRPGWPSMMRGYLNEEARYKKCFSGGWYRTGDLAMRDSDGYYWFVGRADDVIKSSGHLIGPFEVESTLMEHKAVAEAGVIGIPEPTAGEVVKAYAALNPGFAPSELLRKELLGHARQRLGPAVAPKVIAFRQNLPKTRNDDGCSCKAAFVAPAHAGSIEADDPHPPLRGQMCRVVHAGEDPRLHAPLRRRGGGRGRRDRRAGEARPDRGDLSRARASTGARRADGHRDGRDVWQAGRL